MGGFFAKHQDCEASRIGKKRKQESNTLQIKKKFQTVIIFWKEHLPLLGFLGQTILTRPFLIMSLSSPKASFAAAPVNSGKPCIGAYSLSRFLDNSFSSA